MKEQLLTEQAKDILKTVGSTAALKDSGWEESATKYIQRELLSAYEAGSLSAYEAVEAGLPKEKLGFAPNADEYINEVLAVQKAGVGGFDGGFDYGTKNALAKVLSTLSSLKSKSTV